MAQVYKSRSEVPLAVSRLTNGQFCKSMPCTTCGKLACFRQVRAKNFTWGHSSSNHQSLSRVFTHRIWRSRRWHCQSRCVSSHQKVRIGSQSMPGYPSRSRTRHLRWMLTWVKWRAALVHLTRTITHSRMARPGRHPEEMLGQPPLSAKNPILGRKEQGVRRKALNLIKKMDRQPLLRQVLGVRRAVKSSHSSRGQEAQSRAKLVKYCRAQHQSPMWMVRRRIREKLGQRVLLKRMSLQGRSSEDRLRRLSQSWTKKMTWRRWRWHLRRLTRLNLRRHRRGWSERRRRNGPC